MKYIITILAVLLMGYAASAQGTGYTVSTPAIDTLDDAETIYLSQPRDGYFYGNTDGIFTVSFTATKISGTGAGNAIIQTSVDGTNWSNLYGTSADTFTLTDVATQIKTWYVSGTMTKNVRIKFVGSGTESVQVKGYFIKD